LFNTNTDIYNYIGYVIAKKQSNPKISHSFFARWLTFPDISNGNILTVSFLHTLQIVLCKSGMRCFPNTTWNNL